MGVTRITGYGPNSSEARVEEIRRAFAAWGVTLELCAKIAPPDAAVVHGRIEWVNALFDAGLTTVSVTSQTGSRTVISTFGADGELLGLILADRTELAAVLARLGREGDAAKVTNGPPDQPRPDGGRLLVCLVDEICVAVTWSQGTTPPRSPIFFDARRVL